MIVCNCLIKCFIMFIFVDKWCECDYTVGVENKRKQEKERKQND